LIGFSSRCCIFLLIRDRILFWTLLIARLQDLDARKSG
jgi:hypothetical protein